MSEAEVTSNTKKRKKGGKKSNKISFDAEIITKSAAEELNKSISQKDSEKTDVNVKSKKNKRTKQKANISEAPPSETAERKPKKRKRNNTAKSTINTEDKQSAKNEENSEAAEENVDEPEIDSPGTTAKGKESKRAQKRKKHQQLLLDNKVKVDVALQEKSLNYLSRWKHNRDDWKFEKLRQVWLQQNMFDNDRIPDQLWDTVVEYFSGAKGQIRRTILDDALKIVDKSENERDKKEEEEIKNGDDEDEDNDNKNNDLIKVDRARSIIQCLQE